MLVDFSGDRKLRRNRSIMIAAVAAVSVSLVSCGAANESGSVGSESLSISSKPTRAVLSVIAHAEGTGSSYNFIFSYRKFSSYADHPRQVVCSGGYCSDAAGRYQFLSTSWDETRRGLGIKDFTPDSQDKGAVQRMQSFRGVREHSSVLSRPAFERMIYKLNREWASLPGSPYGQPTKSMSSLWTVYQAEI
jgi:muramidase (phage lysozyme)